MLILVDWFCIAVSGIKAVKKGKMRHAYIFQCYFKVKRRWWIITEEHNFTATMRTWRYWHSGKDILCGIIVIETILYKIPSTKRISNYLHRKVFNYELILYRIFITKRSRNDNVNTTQKKNRRSNECKKRLTIYKYEHK